MLTLYVPTGAIVERQRYEMLPTDLPTAVWLDLHDPSPAEVQAVERSLKLDLPSREEMQEIEATSRLYEEGDALFMTATVLAKADSDEPESHAITFVVTASALVTIRYSDPIPFLSFSHRIERTPSTCTTSDVAFVGLLEAIVDRIADVLERTSMEIERIGQSVFRRDPRRKLQGAALNDALTGIGRSGTLISAISESVMSLTRVVTFFGTTASPWLHKGPKTHVKTLTRDLRSLNEHAGFLSQKSNFMLDATLGMINIEQNMIIKLFTVAAVGFMPPTLIASIYGMNFKNLPELEFEFGYPMALGMMVLSALIPFLYFKRRGWL
jgi:magnesium transporter